MKKFTLIVAGIAFLLAGCSKKEEPFMILPAENVLKEKSNPAAVPDGEAYSKSKVDGFVKQTLEERNDFHWEWVELRMLWSALQSGDHSLAIGYKPAETGDISNTIHELNIRTGEWKSVHDALIDFIVKELSAATGTPIKWEDILVEDDPILPILTIKLTNKTVLTRLYNLKNVRYLEPLDYYPEETERSGSGCDGSTTTVNSSDWTTITPNCKQPWNYASTNIPAAWNISTGTGVTIGVIDAGISSSQSLLGLNFNNGLSTGRTITTDYTIGTSAYTTCAHGTSMSGLAAGARNNLNSSIGVAYNANLHFIRGCNDVVLESSAEKTGVKNALVKMGDLPAVKIVSMSVGSPFSSSVLEDGVNYAYGRGKMLFAAAGTSFSWTSWWGVVYPAALTKCVAITGVKENGNTCASCHDGSQVDFTIPMERNNNSNRNTVSLAPNGFNPTYAGGSSCATAMSAGIAGLIWSARPTLTREQVLNALKTTSQNYPSINSSRGYGNINAGAAVSAAMNY